MVYIYGIYMVYIYGIYMVYIVYMVTTSTVPLCLNFTYVKRRPGNYDDMLLLRGRVFPSEQCSLDLFPNLWLGFQDFIGKALPPPPPHRRRRHHCHR